MPFLDLCLFIYIRLIIMCEPGAAHRGHIVCPSLCHPIRVDEDARLMPFLYLCLFIYIRLIIKKLLAAAKHVQ